MNAEFLLAAAIGGVIGGIALACLLFLWEMIMEPPSPRGWARWFLGMS